MSFFTNFKTTNALLTQATMGQHERNTIDEQLLKSIETSYAPIEAVTNHMAVKAPLTYI